MLLSDSNNDIYLEKHVSSKLETIVQSIVHSKCMKFAVSLNNLGDKVILGTHSSPTRVQSVHMYM